MGPSPTKITKHPDRALTQTTPTRPKTARNSNGNTHNPDNGGATKRKRGHDAPSPQQAASRMRKS
jgi:hypothetical protein